MKYALELQFLDRPEVSRKVNGEEKVWLLDLLENNDGNPKDGKLLDSIKKELRILKVAVNRDNLSAVSPRKRRGRFSL